MNFLGMGPMELLLIVVLALIVFGPARLPEIMAQVGKAIGDFRRATSELSDEFNRTIQAELQETRALAEETKATFADAKASVYDAHASVNSAIAGTPAPVRTAVPGDLGAASNGAATPAAYAEPATNGAAPAQTAPALANTSEWSWETSPSPVVAPPATPAPDTAPGSPSSETAPVTPSSETAPVTPSSDAAPATPSTPSPPKEPAARDELLPPY